MQGCSPRFLQYLNVVLNLRFKMKSYKLLIGTETPHKIIDNLGTKNNFSALSISQAVRLSQQVSLVYLFYNLSCCSA